MNPVSYFPAADIEGALAYGQPGVDANAGDAKFIAGGTNLIDLMKVQVMQPRALVDAQGRADTALVGELAMMVMKINPAVLMGGVAGARSHSGPAREAAKEIGSSVPWIGFPVGYAVSGVLLTVFGYLAMVLSK